MRVCACSLRPDTLTDAASLAAYPTYGGARLAASLPLPTPRGAADGSLRASTDGVAAALGAALASRRSSGGTRAALADTSNVGRPRCGPALVSELGRWASARESQKQALGAHVAWLKAFSGQIRSTRAHGEGRVALGAPGRARSPAAAGESRVDLDDSNEIIIRVQRKMLR